MHKGDPVTLKGRFRTSTFEDKHGHLRTSIEITADTVGHDLNRGQATFLRPPPLRTGEDNRQAARAASAPEPAGGADEDFMDDEAIERLGRDLDEADLATQALREHERLAGADDHEDSEDADDDDSEEEAYQNAALANDAPDADTAVGTVPPVPATPF
jgi:single-strand DNA-binding protein